MNTRDRQPEAIILLKPSMIREGDRLRPVSPDRVREIMASWQMPGQGQLTPIEVGPADAEGVHDLIAGAHRLAAAREMDVLVAAIIRDVPPGDARRLREIDENLYRAELNALDEAVFLAERQAIYERLHGETRGRPKKAANLAVIPKGRTFAADVAEKIGLSERTVFRALGRFAGLSEASRARLRGTPLAENGAELDALCKRTPQQQALILDMVLPKAGEPTAKSIREALAVMQGRAEPAAPDPDAVRAKLERLFWQLPKGKPRRDFAAWAKARIDADQGDGE